MNPSLNPWNLSYTDPRLNSPDGRYEIEYRNIGEIAMSGPHGADCAILLPGGYLLPAGKRAELDEWVGGPLVWKEDSTQFAIPIWTKGRNQRMGVVDVATWTLTVFAKPFRVLSLERFEKGTIYGVDSPIYRTVNLTFQPDQEEIERIKPLQPD